MNPKFCPYCGASSSREKFAKREPIQQWASVQYGDEDQETFAGSIQVWICEKTPEHVFYVSPNGKKDILFEGW